MFAYLKKKRVMRVTSAPDWEVQPKSPVYRAKLMEKSATKRKRGCAGDVASLTQNTIYDLLQGNNKPSPTMLFTFQDI
jgi:hypothetical protein